MDSLRYAVEFAHDENLLGSPSSVSHLSQTLARLTLRTAEESNNGGHNLHGKLLQLQRAANLLDTQIDSPDYYAQKEQLIFKVVCELRGIDHEKWLQGEMGLMDDAAYGEFLQDTFVCDPN